MGFFLQNLRCGIAVPLCLSESSLVRLKPRHGDVKVGSRLR
jgi:hypothetical protein